MNASLRLLIIFSPGSQSFAGFAAFLSEPPLLGQEFDLVMFGLLEPAPPDAPRTVKASPRKRVKAAMTSAEDEKEGELEVEVTDAGGEAALPSGEDMDEVAAGTGGEGDEAVSRGAEVIVIE